MGYYMNLMKADFKILKNNHDNILKAIKELAGKETIKDSGGRHFSWVETRDFLEARHIEDAFKAWRWEVSFDENDDINDISFNGEKSGDDDIFFKAIAPFVVDGSYIQMQGEDGYIWRWIFKGKSVTEVPAKISFNEVIK